MSGMKIFLVLVAGIHDQSGTRRDGFTVYAANRDEAAQAACDEFSLAELPERSVVIPVSGPCDTQRRAAA